jgi:hypothetical protein
VGRLAQAAERKLQAATGEARELVAAFHETGLSTVALFTARKSFSHSCATGGAECEHPQNGSNHWRE